MSIGPAAAGLLTSIPVLCFGALAPAVSWLIARTGMRRAVFISLVGVLAGEVLRSAGGLGLALAGTGVLGAAMTVGNIVSLMVIARYFRDRMSATTALYASALNVGTMLTSALTVPVAAWGGWRLGLACWAVMAIAALVLWVVVGTPSSSGTGHAVPVAPISTARGTADSGPSLWRRPLPWLLTVAMAVHLSIYYGLTAWLPAFLVQRAGMDVTAAGLASAVFQILGLVGAFGVPVLASSRRIGDIGLLVAVALAWAATPLGLLLLPSWWPLWALTGGIASGGGFTVIFMMIMATARDLDDNRRISALVQGFGYAVASVVPFAVGGLHQATGSWAAAFLALSASAAIMVAAALVMARLRGTR